MSKVKNSRGRNWTPEELNDFPLLLFDEENCFSADLETPSLKKNLLKNFFDQKIKVIDFIQKNVVSNQCKISRCAAFFEVAKLF